MAKEIVPFHRPDAGLKNLYDVWMIQLQKHLQFLDIRLHNPLVWRGLGMTTKTLPQERRKVQKTDLVPLLPFNFCNTINILEINIL